MELKKCAARGVAALVAAATGLAYGGPDVIVGDLTGVSHYGSQSVNGEVIHAYSVGTTSCNAGDTPLLWIANTNQHPVIGQTCYRMDVANGRLEQIGQSWLKHGFTALQGTVCYSDCQAYPNGTRLGVHCSDPYGAGLNGDQSGLGPKWQVNAATGVFAYPYSTGGTTGTIGKRLQVRATDLSTANFPGAIYFVAGQYVTPDDASSGNKNNNESYRRVTVNANLDMANAGTTQRTKPAIMAWKEHGLGVDTPDPGVNITVVDVPGDGRFYIASKVISLPGGRFRYEYGIENLSSDRSGQAFHVPVPAAGLGAVTNPAFHDVDYHSGEPFATTNWTYAAESAGVSWATQTFAQNQNANALRWGTMYNFRFECATPPAAGMVTLDLFKGGSPTSIQALAHVPSADGVYHPFNDSCAIAPPVGIGSVPFDSTNADTDGPDQPANCVVQGNSQFDHDLWYTFTTFPCDGPVTVSTCGSSFDTKVAIYPGGSCPSAGSLIACNDDAAGGACGGTLQSSVTFNSVANTPYLIRVGGYNGASGPGTLTVAASNCQAPPPANDTCAGAIFLASGVTYSGSTALATNDGTATCGDSSGSPDVWHRYRPQTTGSVTVVTCGSTYDTVLAVYSGTCGALTQLACNDDEGTSAACSGNTLQSAVTLNMTAGNTYYIRVAGYQGETGNYSVRATGGNGVIPPANDDCNNRAGIAVGDTAISTVGASTDGATHASCNFNGSNQISNDIWYNYPSHCDGTVTVETCPGSSFNTKIAAYTGDSCGNWDSRLIACSDDACATQSSVTFPVAAGSHYTLRVGGFNGASGTGTLRITCVPTPACDPDLNADGNVDQDDVACLIDVVAGNPGCTTADPDFNGDGNVDQGDVEALINVVAGGECP